MKYAFVLVLTIPLFFSCRNDKQDQHTAAVSEDAGTPPSASREVLVPTEPPADTLRPEAADPDTSVRPEPLPSKPNRVEYRPKISTTSTGSPAPPAGLRGSVGIPEGFVDIQQLDPSIQMDIRYATTNNFTESKIYDCPRCLLRKEAAQALVKAQRLLQRQGLGLKMFDCYRPQPYQQRLWDKVPNPDYVMPPEKGSMHSRGAAVDLTLVDGQGNELEMGTPFDFFGPEAHTTYYQLPAHVLKNRQILRRVMEDVGMKGIRTEWWHYSYQLKRYTLSDWVWECR